MGIEKKLVAEKVRELQVKEFLSKELTRVGYSGAEIKRTPLGTRIILNVLRPGRIIGRSGHKIKELTRTLQKNFNLENPHIEVKEVEVPELDANIMAQRIASSMERGFHFKRVGHRALTKILECGALGAQVTISGKVPGKRGKEWKFIGGYLKHCGETADTLILHGFATAYLKPGVVGIKVAIMPPGAQLPDAILKTPTKHLAVTESASVDEDLPTPPGGKAPKATGKEETADGDTEE